MTNSMLNAFIVLSTFFSIVLVIIGKPVVVSDLMTCEGQPCPNNTFGCAVSTKINPDNKTQLISHIQCLGPHHEVLENSTVISKNPFGPNVYFQGYRYKSAIRISSNPTIPDTSSDKEVEEVEPLGSDENNIDEIEQFDK